MNRRRGAHKTLVWLMAAAVTAACAGGGAESTTTAPPSTTLPPTTTTTAATTTSSVLETAPVVTQLDWFLDLLNGVPLEADDYEARISDEFLRQVPADAFRGVIDQIRSASPVWQITGFEQRTATAARALIAPPSGEPALRVIIEVADDPPHRIGTLFVQPAEPPALDDPPESLEEAASRLAEQGTLRLLAAEVVDGVCVPVVGVAPEEPAPLGSMFKLYVLGALAQAVASGEVSWDDPVTVRDELKSPPSGILQNEPDGTVKTVREVAELMISISDNTATDHLIDLLGRSRIEAALPALGSTTPELNVPFLTTRELIALKVGFGAGLRQAYLDGDEAARRAVLDQISGLTVEDLPVAEWTEPVDPDRLEWFATPADLCALLVDLQELAARPGLEPVREILSINPGLPDAEGRWSYLAFKGGSEPGLLAMSWLGETAAGRTFVLAGSVVNPERPLDELETVLLLGAARDLLGAMP